MILRVMDVSPGYWLIALDSNGCVISRKLLIHPILFEDVVFVVKAHSDRQAVKKAREAFAAGQKDGFLGKR